MTTNLPRLEYAIEHDVSAPGRDEIKEGISQGPECLRESPGPDGRQPFMFDPKPYRFPEPASIPKREWLHGRHYMRGVVSMTVGAPGRAKSTLSMKEIIGASAGLDLIGGKPLPGGPLRAAYLNGEETQEELDRRAAAIFQRYQITREMCGDRLWIESTRDKPLRLATLGPRGNAVAEREVVDALVAWCEARALDMLALDPMISFHRIRENDNGDVDLLCKEAVGLIAGKTRSVDLVQHTRKLANGEVNTTVDDARGASAALGAVRIGRTVNFMTTTEADQLCISEDDRRLYIRVENGKANPGPLGKANWIKIEIEKLPNGDEVACVTSWKPKNPFDDVLLNDLKVVQKQVQGGACRTDSQSKHWLGWWMAENLPHLKIKTRYEDKPRDKTAKAEVAKLNKIIGTWRKNNTLEIVPGEDANRHKRQFFAVPAAVAEPDQGGGDDDEISFHGGCAR